MIEEDKLINDASIALKVAFQVAVEYINVLGSTICDKSVYTERMQSRDKRHTENDANDLCASR